MARDEALSEGVRAGSSPVLRFYEWSVPSVSLGCFQRASDLDLQYLKSEGIPLVRRLTGGRAILHGEELTYCLAASSRSGPFSSGGLKQCYGLIGQVFHQALTALGLEPEVLPGAKAVGRAQRSPSCFNSPSLGEIMFNGRKAVGSAQKRWPEGFFMQQGSFPLVIDYGGLRRVFGDGPEDAPESRMVGLREIKPEIDVQGLKDALMEAFESVFQIRFQRSAMSEEEESLAGRLAERYSSDQWNMSRARPG